jgi:phospholipase/carboxylesterase
MDLPLRYVMRVPSSADGPLPLVVCLHGRGADMNDLADVAPLLDSDGSGGYRFLFPNAPRPFEPMPGYSFGWTWFDGWPPTSADLTESRKLLLDFLDAAVAHFSPPAGKVVLSGFSQGALMSFDAGFRTQQPLAGIVAMSGALAEDDLPTFRMLPVLIAHGTDDEVISVNAARRARHILEEHGLAPEYHEFPIGHQVSVEELDVVREFLGRVLKS